MATDGTTRTVAVTRVVKGHLSASSRRLFRGDGACGAKRAGRQLTGGIVAVVGPALGATRGRRQREQRDTGVGINRLFGRGKPNSGPVEPVCRRRRGCSVTKGGASETASLFARAVLQCKDNITLCNV